MDSFSDFLPTILVFIGLGLLAIEVAVLGFAVMLLFFIGVGCLAAGLIMMTGLIASTLSSALLWSGLLSLVSAAALWKPLKKLQDGGERTPVTSDLIGNCFVLDTEITDTSTAEVRYSGVTWKVKSDTSLPAGTEVEIVATRVGELTVAPRGEK